jgi:hypothetical protein
VELARLFAIRWASSKAWIPENADPVVVVSAVLSLMV